LRTRVSDRVLTWVNIVSGVVITAFGVAALAGVRGARS
jgi:hypothetical protein